MSVLPDIVHDCMGGLMAAAAPMWYQQPALSQAMLAGEGRTRTGGRRNRIDMNTGISLFIGTKTSTSNTISTIRIGAFQTIGVTEKILPMSGDGFEEGSGHGGHGVGRHCHQPTPDTPMLVRRATVRWSKGHDFGIALWGVLPNQNRNQSHGQSDSGLWSRLN